MSDSLYIAIYFLGLLFFASITAILPLKSDSINRPYFDNRIMSMVLLLIVFVHITFRSSDYRYFGDSAAYAWDFQEKALFGKMAIKNRDIGFEYFSYFLSQFVSLKVYWFILCCLYVLPVYFALKKHFRAQYFVALAFFVYSFSFWGYGVNGLRNGIATSLVLFSFLITDSDIKRLPIWIIAYFFHKSVLLSIVCFVAARIFKSSKIYLCVWLLCLFAALIMRSSISEILANIPWFAQDERMLTYLNMSSKGMENMFSYVGFRWDFLIYSIIPIILGWRYINKYKFRDSLYIRLLNTYISANAFWLLTIYVPYTNRFAYLSWFLYPVIVIYPLLEKNLIVDQGSKIQKSMLIYYLFTFVMWLR